MRKILLTGFEPFNQDSINPSWEAVKLLDGLNTHLFHVRSIELPCVFGQSVQQLSKAIALTQPDIVIAVGLAAGRSEISVERVAINIDDARIPDNANNQPIDIPVVPDAPAAYFSTLPIKAIVQKIRQEGIPAGVSQSAGSFVCNHVFYGLMHHVAQHSPNLRAGFIHVPAIPQQVAKGGSNANQPSMSLTDIVRGLRIALAVCCTQQHDIVVAGGQTS